MQKFDKDIILSGKHKVLDLTSLSYIWNDSQIVNGYMELDCLDLTSLNGSPEIVNNYFVCTCNRLIDLIGGPRIVLGSFMCGGNPLLSLEGAPDICIDFMADNCENLNTLHGIGRKYLKSCQQIVISNSPITQNVLGLLLIDGLYHIHFNYSIEQHNKTKYPQNLVNIINKAISDKTDLLEVQEQLINEGLKDYAKL